VVIPGRYGSGPGHWQTWLEEQSADDGRPTRRPDFANLDEPELGDWLAALRRTLADLPADGYDVVAHSLGAVLWLHHVADPAESPRAARVLLVAPPSPATKLDALAAFFPPPMDVDTVRQGADGTVLVGGEADPYCPEGVAAAYGVPLKMAATVVDGAGPVGPESGYGAWPAVLDWCRRDNLAFY
jgi:predicted alpha/beta hydrolase family esterase